MLINGERIANKSMARIAELQRIVAANVERIEIVDASTLASPGLPAEVANIILKQARKAGGQYQRRPDFRAHYSRSNLFRGNRQLYRQDARDRLYALARGPDRRGGLGGPELFYAADGSLIERREEVYHSESDTLVAKAQARL